jgi:hypothetical protein
MMDPVLSPLAVYAEPVPAIALKQAGNPLIWGTHLGSIPSPQFSAAEHEIGVRLGTNQFQVV